MLYRVRMRAAALRPIAVLAAAVVLAALSGCMQTTEKPTPTPSAAATPAFASDEEALAAAEKAYAAYLAVSNDVGHSGGVEPERFEKVSSSGALTNALTAAQKFRDSKSRLVGDTKFKSMSLQRANYSDPATVELEVYVCDDVSATDVLDSGGVSIVKPGRVEIVPFVATFVSSSASPMLLADKTLWSGESFC